MVNYAKKLKIPNFKVLMHDQIVGMKIDKVDNGIINLDRNNNGGTHWVCYSNLPKYDFVLYFDSFGLPPSNLIADFLKTSGKKIKYNNSEMQLFSSIMCGYYCLYVLDKLNKGENLYDVLYKFKQDPVIFNEKLIKKFGSSIGTVTSFHFSS